MLGTLPNLLTLSRIVLIPILVATFFVAAPWANWAAVALFSAAAITDYFDGYLARIWNEQSALGRMLDPIADKLLVAVSILVLVADGMLAGWSIWAAIIVLMREIFVSGLREFLAELRVSVPVTWLPNGRPPSSSSPSPLSWSHRLCRAPRAALSSIWGWPCSGSLQS